MSALEQSSASENADGPSPGVRTAISLLLFIHLFAIFAAISANFGARSGLRQDLRITLIEPYLQALFLDTAYDYGMIYNMTDDWDHTCQIVLNPASDFTGTAEQMANLEVIEMMPEAAWPAMRRRRYLALSYRVTVLEDETDREAALIAALANGMLSKHEITEGAHGFRCLTQEPQPMVLDDIEPEIRDPNHIGWFSTVYHADVVRANDHWAPVKRGGLGEMTQARRGRQRSR